jgi:hypothetical protein
MKSGKFGGRWDKHAAKKMAGKSLIYKVFSDSIGIFEILQKILLGKLTFYH